MFWALVLFLFFFEIRYRLYRPLAIAEHCRASLPVLCSHRGHGKRGKPAENTAAAFRAAERQNFFMHELDVRQTAQGNIYLFHGPYLDGQSDGPHKRLEDCTDEEIQKLNFSHYLQDGSHQPPVLLQEYLAEFSASVTNIEIKRDFWDWNLTLEKKTAQVVDAFGDKRNIFVSAFHFLSMFANNIYFAHVPRGILFEHKKFTSFYLFVLLRLFLPDSLHVPDSYITQERVKKWKQKKFNVAVWTVNSKERVLELLSWGADIIITDNIALGQDAQVMNFIKTRAGEKNI